MESDDLRIPLRLQLSAAVREHDRPAVSALRSALAALDNAEAVRPGEDFQPEVNQYVAGGVVGVVPPRWNGGCSMSNRKGRS
jgi:hypothetical protein